MGCIPVGCIQESRIQTDRLATHLPTSVTATNALYAVCVARPSSQPVVPAATIPTSQMPNAAARYATKPVENSPPCASSPDHTPPTAIPHRPETQKNA